jgi:ATP-dependent exoDNAse (exonuclease V) beta subunit
MDAAEREREQHETRRLLYVAMTRARDRLYLSSALKDGQLKPGPGSLAEVIPPSLKPIFPAAAISTERTLSWRAPSGRMFTWRICPPAADEAVPAAERAGNDPVPALVHSFEPPRDRRPRLGNRHASVTEWLALESRGAPAASSHDTSNALVGTLVHRLFQFTTMAGIREVSHATVLSLLRPEERVTIPDVDLAIETSIGCWHRLRSRADVVAAMTDAEVFVEVPFSLHREAPEGPVVLRGTIDCLTVSIGGAVTVIEFKTGGFREEHQRQLQLYVEAARSLFPDRSVSGLLVHA